MRRVGAASLATIDPMARTARDPDAAKHGDVTDMFAESVPPVPACVIPAAAVLASVAPPPAAAAALPAGVTPIPACVMPGAAVQAPPAAPRATWRERVRGFAARFHRPAPREELPAAPDPRVARLQTRRSGVGPSA